MTMLDEAVALLEELARRDWDMFMAHVSPEPNTGCWLWMGYVNRGGYGRLNRAGRGTLNAHRYAYELLTGPIPAGLQVDHLCRVRSCVNPAHLEAVTHQENIRRGDNGRHNAVKTHCPSGHLYSEANTKVNVKGSRECRVCIVLGSRRRRRIAREKAA